MPNSSTRSASKRISQQKGNTLSEKSSKKTSPQKETAEKKKRTIPNKKPRTIFEDKNVKKKCNCDHTNVMVSKEETDKIYFKKGFDLEKTHCVVCDIFFSDEPAKEEVCYVPSTTQPTYFYLGRTKF